MCTCRSTAEVSYAQAEHTLVIHIFNKWEFSCDILQNTLSGWRIDCRNRPSKS